MIRVSIEALYVYDGPLADSFREFLRANAHRDLTLVLTTSWIEISHPLGAIHPMPLSPPVTMRVCVEVPAGGLSLA